MGKIDRVNDLYSKIQHYKANVKLVSNLTNTDDIYKEQYEKYKNNYINTNPSLKALKENNAPELNAIDDMIEKLWAASNELKVVNMLKQEKNTLIDIIEKGNRTIPSQVEGLNETEEQLWSFNINEVIKKNGLIIHDTEMFEFIYHHFMPFIEKLRCQHFNNTINVVKYTQLIHDMYVKIYGTFGAKPIDTIPFEKIIETENFLSKRNPKLTNIEPIKREDVIELNNEFVENIEKVEKKPIKSTLKAKEQALFDYIEKAKNNQL